MMTLSTLLLCNVYRTQHIVTRMLIQEWVHYEGLLWGSKALIQEWVHYRGPLHALIQDWLHYRGPLYKLTRPNSSLEEPPPKELQQGISPGLGHLSEHAQYVHSGVGLATAPGHLGMSGQGLGGMLGRGERVDIPV